MSKQSEYWAKRFAQLEESQHASSEAKAAEIEKQFKEAERTIQNQISEWYVRFADENGEISITKAKKLLNSKELEELRWDVNEYIKYGEENALNQKWMHELENASAKVHINRLEALKLRIQAEGEKLYGSVEDGVKKHIKKQYKDSYYHTAYEIAKGSGVGVNFAAVNEKKLEALINKPWAADGKNFAVRLGESKAQLIDNVYKSLVQMTLTGENPDKAISMLSKTMDGDKKRAARIIMTESAYFTELANKDSYKELGVEQYEIIATLDSRTSEICQEMDGKVFDLKDMEPGVTAPPFHPNCRSCTAPYYDDSEFENDEDFKSFVGERAARDEEGKYYTVPANTTYKKWYKGFVGEKTSPEKEGFIQTNLQFFGNNVDNKSQIEYIRNANTENEVVKLHSLGKIDLKTYENVSKDIVTDELIITDERLSHIKERHPEDYEKYLAYIEECATDPDYLIEANKPNSALALKEIADENNRKFRVVVRVTTSKDDPIYKNSIISYQSIKEKEWDRLLRNKSILYKKSK